MALSLHKALPGLSKLEPLDRTNYRYWSQKQLIFFEQLEDNYVLFSDLTKENNTSETTVASDDRTDKSKTIDDKTRRKFEKDNIMVRGYLLNYMSTPLFDLLVTFKSVKII